MSTATTSQPRRAAARPHAPEPLPRSSTRLAWFQELGAAQLRDQKGAGPQELRIEDVGQNHQLESVDLFQHGRAGICGESTRASLARSSVRQARRGAERRGSVVATGSGVRSCSAALTLTHSQRARGPFRSRVRSAACPPGRAWRSGTSGPCADSCASGCGAGGGAPLR